MEVYDQPGDTLAGKLLDGGIDIYLELGKSLLPGGLGVGSIKSADINLEILIRGGEGVLANALFTTPV